MASGQSGVSLASGITANSSGSGAEGASKQGANGKIRQSSEELRNTPYSSGAAAQQSSSLTAENLAALGGQERAELDEVKRKYAIATQIDAQKRLASIKAERKELRTKLDQFQKNFE